jgi:glycyl-tRNA synthetase beta chain
MERIKIMADFLLEIGLEEVPARMIAAAEAELGRRLHDLLAREALLEPTASTVTYSTPRRLAVLVKGILAHQQDTEEKLTGPAWKIAFNAEGKPTGAAEAFAKKAGVAVTALEKVTLPKGDYVGATVARKGRSAAEVLSEQLPKEIAGIYWAKNMYWRKGKPERFVRPLRWLVALLDREVVPLEFAGIKAGRVSYGHRVLHGESPVAINAPADYAAALNAAKVVVNVAERRERIRKALDTATRTIPGARWREDEGLIETVTHLTEWPSVLLGSFEAAYLDLPEEVLVTVMRDHQKYFAVEDASGKLAAYFLAVLNTDGDPEGLIRHGNERVLRARFNDARFFWNFDQKISLVERVELLKSVTFQKDLGSYARKSEQNLAVAEALAAKVTGVDKAALATAVKLAKTDLTAELVKEFTELQGVVGGLYARAQGLGEKVAQAIYWQYSPASTEDKIPPTIEGQLLGLADRIHTVSEMFSIGLEPTGSKDPFALRRAANAIVKILAESDLPLTFTSLIAATGKPADKVQAFLHERLSFYLKDVRGVAYDVVGAVLAADADDVRDAIARSEALTAVRGSEDFTAISAAFKRIKNILRQATEKKEPIATTIPAASALVEAEEKALLAAYEKLVPVVAELSKARNYTAALEQIATLRPVVDAFFDKVMVMAPDATLRANRLALIQSVLSGFSGIADFSEMVAS